MYNDETQVKVNATASLPSGTIGFITWIVFLVLKLCNLNNPDFEWLTWFWVWFPFWLPWAIYGVFLLIAFIVAIIVAAINK